MEVTVKAALTYYLFEGILTGLAADRVFHLTALSGGGGGTTRSKPTAATNGGTLIVQESMSGDRFA